MRERLGVVVAAQAVEEDFAARMAVTSIVIDLSRFTTEPKGNSWALFGDAGLDPLRRYEAASRVEGVEACMIAGLTILPSTVPDSRATVIRPPVRGRQAQPPSTWSDLSALKVAHRGHGNEIRPGKPGLIRYSFCGRYWDRTSDLFRVSVFGAEKCGIAVRSEA